MPHEENASVGGGGKGESGDDRSNLAVVRRVAWYER